MYAINAIKNFFDLFKASQFTEPYPWLLQQFGHLGISVVFCYLTSNFYAVVAFWIAWEVRHLILSKNSQDFFEDLLFELLGVAYFVQLKDGFSKSVLLYFLGFLMLYCIIKFKLYKNN